MLIIKKYEIYQNYLEIINILFKIKSKNTKNNTKELNLQLNN